MTSLFDDTARVDIRLAGMERGLRLAVTEMFSRSAVDFQTAIQEALATYDFDAAIQQQLETKARSEMAVAVARAFNDPALMRLLKQKIAEALLQEDE